MSVFKKEDIANAYDAYYQTEMGRKVDEIERKLMHKLLSSIPRGNMLELGCGTGHWTKFFIDEGFRLTALDNSEMMLKLAEHKHIPAKFQWADAGYLPVEDSSYPAVSSVTMLEFVEDQEKVMEEMYRVLQPGGWLILGCLNADSMLGKTKEQSETFRNAKFFTPGSLKQKLQRFGTPQMGYGVYFSSDFELLDDTPEKVDAAPAFMAAIVKKSI